MAKNTEAPASVRVTGKIDKASVTSDLIDSVTYTDVAHGSADSVEFTLDNSDGAYYKSLPGKGSKVKIVIQTKNWKGITGKKSVRISTGRMYVDSVSASGPEPESVSVTALSKPSYGDFSAWEQHHTYRSTTAKAILKKIAKRNKMTLKYYGPKIKIKKIKQDEATDSDFAVDLCERYGLRIKIYNEKLIVYSAKKYARKKAVKTIKKKLAGSGFEYTTDIQGAYTVATNTYQDKKKKKDKKVRVGHPKIKKTYTYYKQATLKREMKVKTSRRGGKTAATFPKGKKLRIVKRYSDGWAKVAYTKLQVKTVMVQNSVSGSASALFKTARSQVGYAPGHSGSKYGSGAWCGHFMRWCFNKSGNSHFIAGISTGYVPNWVSWAKSHGRWTHTPHPGDAVIFDWNGNGSGDHVGMVYKVHGNKNITTIEGNTGSGCVAVRHRTGYILGYVSLKVSGGNGKARGKHKEKKKVRVTKYGYLYIGKKNQNASVKTVKVTHKHSISRTLAVDTAGYNKADAKRIAKAKMAQANEAIEKLTMTIPGGYKQVTAASVVKLGSDWSKLAGKWFVDQVQHNPSASSFYTQELELHRITSSNGGKTYRKKGSKAKFKGGYVHSSSKGGKAHKVKGPQKIRIKKVSKKGKYTYQIESLPKYAKSKTKKVQVLDYGPSTRKTGANGRKLTSSCCACDWLPIGSKIKIGGKTYTVADRAHGKTKGIMIYHSSTSYQSKGARTVTIKYQKKTKFSKVIGWVNAAALSNLTTAQKKADKNGRVESSNRHQTVKTGGLTYTVKATHKASFSYYTGKYDSYLKKRVGTWTGLCCAAPSSVPIGTIVRISGTGTSIDGKYAKVVDRGGVITVHRGNVYWIDIHLSAGGGSYKDFRKAGRHSGKVQILKKR